MANLVLNPETLQLLSEMMRNAVAEGYNSPQFEERVRNICRSELTAHGGSQRVTSTVSTDKINNVVDEDKRSLSEYRLAVSVEKYRVSVPFIGADKTDLMSSIRTNDDFKKVFADEASRPTAISEYRKDDKQFAEFIFASVEKANVMAKSINDGFPAASGGNIVVQPIKFCPKVKITGMPVNVTAVELAAEIIKCNDLPANAFEIVRQYTITAFNKTHYNAIVKIKDIEKFRNLINSGRLFIHFKWCKVYEEVPIESCVKCLRFESHIGCQRTLRCKKCAGIHTTINCKETVNKCINCVRHNAANLVPKLSESHMSSNPNCGAKILHIQKLKEEIRTREGGVNFQN